MWYCRVAGRNVGLATATVVALVLVDMIGTVILIAAVDLFVAGRTKAPRLGVAAGHCEVGRRQRPLSGRRA